jgi:hypothetical protein
MTGAPRLSCRVIAEADLNAVADLLARGFPARARPAWVDGLDRLARRPVPPDLPRFGYCLQSEGALVGALLMLFARIETEAEPFIRCNLSSWYVEPAFRSYGSLLLARALRFKDVVFTDITPAPHTWPIVEARGFVRYCEGHFFTLPILNKPAPGSRVRPIDADAPGKLALSVAEADLLVRHAAHGCLSLACDMPDGAHPFVFTRFQVRSGRLPLPCLRLVYCRSTADFALCAGALGRFLAKRRIVAVVMDATGPVRGLAGLYRAGRGTKFFKGPRAPRLGDLADSEFVLFEP